MTYLPKKNDEVVAVGSHVAQSWHPIKGVLVMMYRMTTTIVCFTVFISALEMNGSRETRCEKLTLLLFLLLFRSTTPDILLLIHIEKHILV